MKCWISYPLAAAVAAAAAAAAAAVRRQLAVNQKKLESPIASPSLRTGQRQLAEGLSNKEMKELLEEAVVSLQG